MFFEELSNRPRKSVDDEPLGFDPSPTGADALGGDIFELDRTELKAAAKGLVAG